MSSQRKYSKAKANGNRVVWTSQEVITVPYLLDGQVYNNAEWGVFRVTGRDMYCTGFRVDFRVPSGDAGIQCNVGIYTADNVLAGGALDLNGVTMGGDKLISPPLSMPVNSLWKFKLEIESTVEDETIYFPQGVTAAYLLRYAQGPVNTQIYGTYLPNQGVGFYQVGTTFIVE